MRRLLSCAPLLAALLLAACGTTTTTPTRTPTPGKPAIREPGMPVLPPAGSGRGGYYMDDGPGENPPPGLMDVPDAEVRKDPLLPRSNRPYSVFGKSYTPLPLDKPFTQRGLGTWYGKKFHGQRTSSGELYDMYKMTAAHPVLPIPSYARVTNLGSGKTVVVRINDRGPFHSTRVIDVSFTAALKLGLLENGSSQLQVDLLMPDEIDQMIAARKNGAPAVASSAASTATAMPKAAPMLASARAPAEVESMMLGGASDGGAADGASVMRAGGAAMQSGFYLQLGAYTRAEAAEAVRDKLSAATPDDKFEVVQVGPVYRLYGGPHATRKDAQQAGKRIPSALRLKPIVIQR